MNMEDLKKTLDEAEWSWIKPHALRDGVIVVSSELNLLEVGKEVAQNNATRINEWITQGLLSKPNSQQIQTWDENPNKRFLCLVVQPFVLVQELLQ